MTMPDTPVIAPDSVISETAPAAPAEPQPITVGEEVIAAARAIVAQEEADRRRGALIRTLRTLGQSAVAAAAVAGFRAYEGGAHDWRALSWTAAEAAVTAVVTYVHNRVRPAK